MTKYSSVLLMFTPKLDVLEVLVFHSQLQIVSLLHGSYRSRIISSKEEGFNLEVKILSFFVVVIY